ncbi:MAG: FkbM family methyltransferase [Candidatus Omnitrophica bacterium]|nr:FkbM family methyltransferase [Candidatus Omnitrophota bacterium]
MKNMGLKRTIHNGCIKLFKGLVALAAGRQASKVLASFAEGITPLSRQSTAHGDLIFFCPGELPLLRADALLTKEPETIAWIDSFFTSDVLWDIGANVGVFSLYAALRENKVMAFEPSPSNYYLLNKNIELNKMDQRISALCLAFNDDSKLDAFYFQNTRIGGALNSFGEALDWQGQAYESVFQQAMIGFRVDDFIQQFHPLFPNHMKIDVDGNEHKIVEGALQTLKDTRLKSVLVELDLARPEYRADIIVKMQQCGLILTDQEKISRMPPSGTHNHIFVRKNGVGSHK